MSHLTLKNIKSPFDNLKIKNNSIFVILFICWVVFSQQYKKYDKILHIYALYALAADNIRLIK